MAGTHGIRGTCSYVSVGVEARTLNWDNCNQRHMLVCKSGVEVRTLETPAIRGTCSYVRVG